MRNLKYLIVGGGAAGLQMGYFLQKEGADYLIFEKSEKSGNFFKEFPIHRRLISINKKHNFFTEPEFNLRHDWNSLLSDDFQFRFTEYSDELYPPADLLYQYLQDYSEKYQLNIRYNCAVTNISKNSSGQFIVKTSIGEEYIVEVLLIATGALRQNMPSEIEGIELTTPYMKMDLNPKNYINKRVAIIGGGNSAFEAAGSIEHLAANVHLFVRNKPKLSHETHFVGNVRAKYTNIFDMFQLKALHAVLQPRIKKITKLPNGNLQTQHEYDYPESDVPGTLKLTREYEYIINCTGFKYTHIDLFDKDIDPATVMNDKFYALNEVWESSNVPNLYFIGTLMQAIDRQSASGFIHGFRYNIRTLSKLLMQFYEHKPYPSEMISVNDFKSFLEKLYTRFSIGDAIYQLYGFLGDLIVFNESDGNVEWFKDLPVKYIQKNLDPNKHSLQLTLEFGFQHFPGKSSMDFMKPSDPHNTEKSYFLHPVIRHFYQGKVEEFHFGDSLLGRWDMPHSEGGAIASYHIEFYNWLSRIFNLKQIDVANLGENPNFEKW